MRDEQGRILQGILDEISATKAAGSEPVVALDLDHTLFDNGPRTVAILRDFARKTGREALARRLDDLPTRNLPYLVKDVLAMIDERDPELWRDAFMHWREDFFYDRTIHHDIAVLGAVDWCSDAFDRGATLVYLSGRDAPNMLMGTVQSLHTHGFPVGVSRTVIVLKPDFDIPDADFKRDTLPWLDSIGTVVAAFDNEPANCNLFARRFESCRSVLLDTAMAPDPPPLDESVGVIDDFRRAAAPDEAAIPV